MVKLIRKNQNPAKGALTKKIWEGIPPSYTESEQYRKGQQKLKEKVKNKQDEINQYKKLESWINEQINTPGTSFYIQAHDKPLDGADPLLAPIVEAYVGGKVVGAAADDLSLAKLKKAQAAYRQARQYMSPKQSKIWVQHPLINGVSENPLVNLLEYPFIQYSRLQQKYPLLNILLP